MTECRPPEYLTRSHLPEFQDLISNSAFFDVLRVKKTLARLSLIRRALLKTTTYTLVGWIALALVLSTRTVTAAALDGVPETLLAAAALGQSGSTANPSEDPRQQSADLLKRARQAMAENDLAAADSLIARAEALGVKQNIFYRGDTPEKARRELERMRNSSFAGKVQRAVGAAGSEPKQADPQHGPVRRTSGRVARRRRQRSASHAFAEDRFRRRRFRSVGRWSSDHASAPGQNYPMTGPDQNELRANGVMSREVSNNSPLRKARLALAVGDVRQAEAFVQEARNMRVNYQPLDDTPDKVEAAIRKHQEIQGLDKTTEAYARVCSRSLMGQADALVRWGEYDEAERLDEPGGGHAYCLWTVRAEAARDAAADRRCPPPGRSQPWRLGRTRRAMPMLRPRLRRPAWLRDKKPFSWSDRPAMRLPPDNWIRPK